MERCGTKHVFRICLGERQASRRDHPSGETEEQQVNGLEEESHLVIHIMFRVFGSQAVKLSTYNQGLRSDLQFG